MRPKYIGNYLNLWTCMPHSELLNSYYHYLSYTLRHILPISPVLYQIKGILISENFILQIPVFYSSIQRLNISTRKLKGIAKQLYGHEISWLYCAMSGSRLLPHITSR